MLRVAITPGNIQDREGAKEVLGDKRFGALISCCSSFLVLESPRSP
jgi:UDP-glucose 4-epimerase